MEKASRRFQPGEGPSRGLLRDYEPSDGPSFQALLRAAATSDPPFVTTIAEAEAGAGGWSPPPGWSRRNNVGFENIHLGPSLYGDIWGELQRITNFSYSMVTPRYIHTRAANDQSVFTITEKRFHI